MDPFERVQRGYDSSGRRLWATRQMFQHFDRVNALVNNKLVIVQGSFNRGTTQSAGTHDLAGCLDIRTWNLTTEERETAMRAGRDPAIVGGAAWWYRTRSQGFEPHIHMLLLGDAPMTPQTASQVSSYRAGRNGLASGRPDDFWRPAVITDYQYIEDDDMFSDDDRALLQRIYSRVDGGFKHEFERDQAERERDKTRYSRMIALLGQQVDLLTNLIDQTEDPATREELRRAKAEMLQRLKDNPDVHGLDNPSDDAMADES